MNCIYCHNPTTLSIRKKNKYQIYDDYDCISCNVLYAMYEDKIGTIILNPEEKPTIFIVIHSFPGLLIGNGQVSFGIPEVNFPLTVTGNTLTAGNIIHNLMWIFPQNFLSVLKTWHNTLVFK